MAAQDTSAAPLIEIDGFVGYTPVEVEKWAAVRRVNRRELTSVGVHGRAFLTFFGQTRVGLEAGYQRLFSYELLTQAGTLVRRERFNVDPFHVGIVARPRARPKVDIDLALGVYFFSDRTLPGFTLGVGYRVLNRNRFSIPVGARLTVIPDENALMIPMSLKIGTSIRP